MNKEEASMERKIISTHSLAELAIYLEGVKAGKGNLLPLGTEHLEQLWMTIKFLRGDVRYDCPEFKPQSNE